MDAKEKKKAAAKDWYAANKEITFQRAMEWKLANPEKVKASGAARYQKDKDRIAKVGSAWHEKNKDRINARKSAWRKANPDAIRRGNHNRRFRKSVNGGRLSPGITQKLMKLQQGKCAICKIGIKSEVHLDHIMPLALGGTNTDQNTQLLCPRCNLRKGAKHPVAHMQSMGFLC